jgi:hypothetical protein
VELILGVEFNSCSSQEQDQKLLRQKLIVIIVIIIVIINNYAFITLLPLGCWVITLNIQLQMEGEAHGLGHCSLSPLIGSLPYHPKT